MGAVTDVGLKSTEKFHGRVFDVVTTTVGQLRTTAASVPLKEMASGGDFDADGVP
jgi:hypothetical protein